MLRNLEKRGSLVRNLEFAAFLDAAAGTVSDFADGELAMDPRDAAVVTRHAESMALAIVKLLERLDSIAND
jgi:hypothetical protein